MDFSDFDNDLPEGPGSEGRDEKLRRFRRALAEGKESLDIPNPDLLEELVEQCIEANALEEGLRYCEQWTVFSPYNYVAWLRTAMILTGLERADEALVAIDRAEPRDPNDIEIRIQRGIAHHTLGHDREAVEILEEGLRQDPRNLELLFNYGLALQSVDRTEDALGVFRLIVGHPDYAVDCWYEIGYCLDILEQYDEAIAAYDRHLDLDPYNANAWYNKGIAQS